MLTIVFSVNEYLSFRSFFFVMGDELIELSGEIATIEQTSINQTENAGSVSNRHTQKNAMSDSGNVSVDRKAPLVSKSTRYYISACLFVIVSITVGVLTVYFTSPKYHGRLD
jgi:NADH:ubiquinone oxidoreductase subunit 3 (subunit A)